MQTGQEELKLCLFADDMILYLKVHRDITRTLLDLLSIFSKVTRQKNQYKILELFLYTNNEEAEEEIKKIITSTIA
jgi:hypothetical protein